MNYLAITSVLLASYLCFVEGQASCQTPRGVSGICRSIFECKPLFDILSNKARTAEDLDFLKKSFCGFLKDTPAVCCPSTNGQVDQSAEEKCYTPDGNTGNCVDIGQCKHIANLMKPPVSKENNEFVQNSKCVGKTKNSVCCGPSTTVKSNSCAASVSAYPPEINSECCGLDSNNGNKIYMGNETAIDQYPWVALIEYHKDGLQRFLCGGALISGRYVLTAGHCVAGPILKRGTPRVVRLSEFDIANDGQDCVEVDGQGIDCTEGVVRIPIESTMTHPDYNPANTQRRNDIALIRLGNLAPYTDFIRPICLPVEDLTLKPPSRFTLYVAGWGEVSQRELSSNRKLFVDLPFVEMKKCQEAYSVPSLRTDLWNKQVCAGGVEGKDSCRGDSGGPLMYENDKHVFQAIGIVSFGPTFCGTVNTPGIYTKVYEYRQWILNSIKT